MGTYDTLQGEISGARDLCCHGAQINLLATPRQESDRRRQRVTDGDNEVTASDNKVTERHHMC